MTWIEPGESSAVPGMAKHALQKGQGSSFYDEFGIDVGKDTESNIMLQAISENTKK